MSRALPTPQIDLIPAEPAALSGLLAAAAERRLSRYHHNNKPLPEPEHQRLQALTETHAAMLTEAAKDFGYHTGDFATPGWLGTELKMQRARADNLDLYINKESDRSAHLARILTPLMRTAPSGGLVVDIGTRSGFFPNHLLQRYQDVLDGRRISGLDLPQDLPTKDHPDFDFRAKPPGKKGEALVKTYAGQEMPYDDGSVSVVTLNCVLHHIEPPTRDPQPDSPELTAFLEELYRVMKPGGVVLITEDYMGKTKEDRENPANPYAKTVLGIDDLFYKNSLGSQRSQAEWVEILEKSGFKVELEKHVGGYNVAGFPVIELVLKVTKPLR